MKETRNIKSVEAAVLSRMVATALQGYNLETQLGTNELPLNDEITLDTASGDGNIVAISVTRHSVVDMRGHRRKFLLLPVDDILTLQDIIHDEYGVIRP